MKEFGSDVDISSPVLPVNSGNFPKRRTKYEVYKCQYNTCRLTAGGGRHCFCPAPPLLLLLHRCRKQCCLSPLGGRLVSTPWSHMASCVPGERARAGSSAASVSFDAIRTDPDAIWRPIAALRPTRCSPVVARRPTDKTLLVLRSN